MRITKVRYHNGRVSIAWTESGDDHSIGSDDEPLPSFVFVRAFEDLVPELAKLCEVKHTEKNPITVRHVSFKHEGETFSAVISGVRGYSESNGVLPLNSPNKFSEGEGEVFTGLQVSKLEAAHAGGRGLHPAQEGPGRSLYRRRRCGRRGGAGGRGDGGG